MINGYFDGLCEPQNPGGISTFGYIYVFDTKVIRGYGLAAPPWSSLSTNNVAEYMGLICLLKSMLSRNVRNAQIFGDSQLVIKQINGKYKIKAERILPLFNEAVSLKKNFDNISFIWVPREMNSDADFLTRMAYRLAKENKLTVVGCYKEEISSLP
ncbi:hypothetical protein HS7_06760 [Sulfolobales archaeon HS-7]|nr:hypothetical protein HS7_06760 [Sulfolobales archaeon HS-7]